MFNNIKYKFVCQAKTNKQKKTIHDMEKPKF